ncbi:MAG TPA: ABC transporter ATP-binding protein [Candidatus Limnocylindria bacterium]|nr:ABC transporter ATP-binding protein [Candidatus Limnocylindria bacterium]
MISAIALRDVGKIFVRDDSDAVEVLEHVDLEIAAGSFVTLVGRSGCGKSTLLNIVAGLIVPSSGTIAFAGEPPAYPRPDVGYLTQKDTLLPWRDVLRNVALPLELRGVEKAAREKRARELLALVGLAHAERRYPRELSGGMQRRASLARMLASDPRILLLDEPFGALDAQLRAELQHELLRLWSGSGKTVVFVTHDIDEALVLADRVVVLQGGGRVAADVEVAFARPRDARSVRTAPDFVALHERLLEALGASAGAAA